MSQNKEIETSDNLAQGENEVIRKLRERFLNLKKESKNLKERKEKINKETEELREFERKRIAELTQKLYEKQLKM